jgi:hypothetical protein
MPKTIAVVKLPEILGNGSSHLVKLAGKIDSFSLLLRETPECELKRSIEVQFHSMVFATRKEIRKYCPRYRSLPGEGILDFNTDCTSVNLSPVISAKPHHPSVDTRVVPTIEHAPEVAVRKKSLRSIRVLLKLAPSFPVIMGGGLCHLISLLQGYGAETPFIKSGDRAFHPRVQVALYFRISSNSTLFSAGS